MPPWNAPKTKVQLRLSVQRLRTLQQKKEAQAKATRREIATVLEKGKAETARIKVEARIKESVCNIIHAAPRTELKELHILRDILMHKYGRDFSIAVMENIDGCVSERVMRKLDVTTPSSELVEAYLFEIAKGYNVNWSPSGVAEADTSNTTQDSHSQVATTSTASDLKQSDKGHEEDTISNQTQTVATPDSGAPTSSSSSVVESDFDALMRRFKDLKKP